MFIPAACGWTTHQYSSPLLQVYYEFRVLMKLPRYCSTSGMYAETRVVLLPSHEAQAMHIPGLDCLFETQAWQHMVYY